MTLCPLNFAQPPHHSRARLGSVPHAALGPSRPCNLVRSTRQTVREWVALGTRMGGTDSYAFSSSELLRDNQSPSVTLFTSAWDTPEEHGRSEGMPAESWNERDKVRVDFEPYYHSAGDLPAVSTDLQPHNMIGCVLH
jgi:hypothetical protein